MATAGSRTSSLGGLLDSSSGTNVGSGLQGSSSGSTLPNSSGKVKRNAGESSQWRRKVRSVDLDKCESGTAALHFLTVSGPGSIQTALLQQSLADPPLSDKTSNNLCNSAQEWMKSSLKSSSESPSAEHEGAAAVDVNASHNR
ncbi:hypothetical protein QQF64_002728 [Cirrhinus molitorella]|uniref:Uncharacterized protein n=1 Tax=Cirrhinus molitorella TaxID=172907 RepID=A0ABR3MQZ8_9TELE